jgi:hypothetical protein
MLSALTFIHRWVGVVLALFMFVWFSTGAIIAFVGAPNVSREQQLAHAASLAPEDGWLSLGDALRASASARGAAFKTERAGGGGMGGRMAGGGEHAGKPHGDAAIAEARLARVDGAPVWLVEDDRGRRFALSALDGVLVDFSVDQALSIARGWLGEAKLSYLDTVDAPIGVRNADTLKRFHRFVVEDDAGTRIVVSARTGEVAQVATRAERGFSYIGN